MLMSAMQYMVIASLMFVIHVRQSKFFKSMKHKIVSKSSSEAEMITLRDSLSGSLLILNFFNDQGYEVYACLPTG